MISLVWMLRKCEVCGRYSMRIEKCPNCGGALHISHPAKFSPEDKYDKYRRELKRMSEKKT
jgi:H/ACA ribonucleoprotein complex subunit 3